MLSYTNFTRFTLGVLVFLTMYSCSRYYRPVRQNATTVDESANFISTKTPDKYFILHKGDKTYALKNITVDKNNLTMSGKLLEVDPSHLLYINAKDERYKYREEDIAVLNEIHLYVTANTAIDTIGSTILPFSQLEKIEVIEHDQARTKSSYVLGGIGIGVGAVVLASVIIALTKESCPYISVYDGEQFVLQGELFGGAINPKLERMDYVPLKAAPLNGEFQIRLSNELKEKQYTDFADLLVIEHAEGTDVFPNADGKLYQVRHLAVPVSAIINDQKNVLDAITVADNNFCSLNDTSNPSGINELKLSFKKNSNETKGKVLLNLKNSYWLDYLYGEFTRHFGGHYETWREKQLNKPVAEMIQWTEKQQIPLTISIETKNGWKEIQKLMTIGPLASRNIIIPFELENDGAQTVNIKLTSGFSFWDVDFSAVDFSADLPLHVTRLKPYSAEEGTGHSVLAELMQNDKNYLAQPQAGSYAILKYHFNEQPQAGNKFSVVLHTSGYYEPIREYTGKPDISFLKKFRKQGYFSEFSMTHFQKLVKEQAVVAVKNK